MGATSGGLRAALKREVLAGALGRTITVVDDAQGSALGAAAMGAVALGLSPSVPAAVEDLATAATGDEAGEAHPEPALVAAYVRARAHPRADR